MVSDHGTFGVMEEIQISKFKTACLAVLDRVGKTRKPVLVTRFGKSVAQVVPPLPSPAEKWLVERGCQASGQAACQADAG